MFSKRAAESAEVQTFWKNVLRHPININPMDDETGNSFDRAQSNGNLLFFAGNDAKDHTRTIPRTIPSGKSLLFAVNPVIITDFEVKDLENKDLASNATKDEDSASLAKLQINDNDPIDLIAENYRVPTGSFEVTFPPTGGRWRVPGRQSAVADGYYLIIEGLERGDYKVKIDAEVADPFPFDKSPPWTSKVTYKFKVV